MACRPQGYELQQCQEEQEAWGASSEKATRAFMENLAVRGGQAAQNAGQTLSWLYICTLRLLFDTLRGVPAVSQTKAVEKSSTLASWDLSWLTRKF